MGRTCVVVRWFAITVLFSGSVAHAQQFHRQPFEGKKTSLRLGLADGEVKLLKHSLETENFYAGKQSERMSVRITSGSFCFVEYEFGKTIIIDELNVTSRVYCNRPGVTIAVRVVLPHEKDEKTGEALTTILRGDKLEVANRWRRLELRRADKLIEQQQMLLQAEKRRKVDIREAYVDMVLFDIQGGMGDVDVLFDDVEIGPLVAPQGPTKIPEPDKIATPILRDEAGIQSNARAPEVNDAEKMRRARVRSDVLQVGDRSFIIRGVRLTDAPMDRLQEAGLNVAFVEWPISPELAEKADQLNVRLVPMLGNRRDALEEIINAGPARIDVRANDPSLFIYLGRGLSRANESPATALLQALRSRDPQKGRPYTAEIDDGLRPYSDHFDLLNVSKFPIGTSLDFGNYHKWLSDKRNFGRPGTLFWTWLAADVSEKYSWMTYGHSARKRFTQPVGPHPDQIRLMTYNALCAGYRGFAFTSDFGFSEAMLGRDRMLGIALLNLELKLIETFLAEGQPPFKVRTSHPNVDAYVFRHPRGVLVIPLWRDRESQFVLGQASVNDLQIVVENAPESAQAFQVSGGEVQSLMRRRDLGGVRIQLREFDTSALIVLTTDVLLLSQYQEKVHQVRAQAASWQRELAEIQLDRTVQLHSRMAALGASPAEVPNWLETSKRQFEDSKEQGQRGDHRMSFLSAQRSVRIARHAQSGMWKKAALNYSTPVSDPFAVSAYTAPESIEFLNMVGSQKPGRNELTSGNFESEASLDALGWDFRKYASDPVKTSVLIVNNAPREGTQSLEMRVEATDPNRLVENSRVELTSPVIPVRAGQIARISGFVKIPAAIQGSVDGAMIWDSLGGESLAIRMTQPSEWNEFLLLRPVREDGEISVHLALMGLGTVQFDDLKVQMIEPNKPLPVPERVEQIATKR